MSGYGGKRGLSRPAGQRPELLRRRDAEVLDAALRERVQAADQGAAVRALLALLDLHCMWTSGAPYVDPMAMATCATCHVSWPCPSRVVIERELEPT